jgi:hypothetical protein
MKNHVRYRAAEPKEQGSFCSISSHVHYDNVDRSAVSNNQETAMRRGDQIDDESGRNSSRVNVTLIETDGQGFDLPTKLGPGK